MINVNDEFLAMKSVKKIHSLKIHMKKKEKTNFKEYLEDAFMEKEVGLFGNECRFLVKLIISFQTEVYTYIEFTSPQISITFLEIQFFGPIL